MRRDRRDDRADLPDRDVHAAGDRRHEGLRLLAHRQPDAPRARAPVGRARRRPALLGLRLRDGGGRRRRSRSCRAATTSWRRATSTAARIASSPPCSRATASRRRSWIPSDAVETWKAAKPNTRLLWLETPSNPLLALCDIAALARTQPARRARRGRQHVRLAVLPEAARARRRHRRPLDDEVRLRP